MVGQNESTYERILGAAAKLFAIKGYDGTTTRQIAKEAGSSLSSIQFHFKSKESLYQTVVDRTVSTFYLLNAPVFEEIDEMERQGFLNEYSAWDLVVQLTGQVVEWAFCKDYSNEILLINRELLQPSDAFIEIPDSLLELYRYYEKLYEAYVGEKGAFWTKALAFSIVTSLFDYANYPKILGQVLKCDIEKPENKQKIKVYMKKYLLSCMRANLSTHKQNDSAANESFSQ